MNNSGGLVGLVIFGLLGWWIYTSFFQDYSKPWWTGTKDMQVCDAEGIKCYTLPVTSDGQSILSVDFPNGGYIIPASWECNKAASTHSFDRFCTIWDDAEREWDVIPYES